MKFAALALDYDGTTAADGVLDNGVREAVGEARDRGVAVILVSGRRLDDLHRVAGDLSCFDVVVGENGGVLEFPASGRHVTITHPPPPVFINELRRQGVAFDVGETLVEMDAGFAIQALDALRRLEQPLVLAFNRSRLMVLSQAIAKSTGLRQALLSLRLSIHNTVGIGDAENDHDLLDACEVGVAVAWGSVALRAVADEVVPGAGPPAVADYIRRLLRAPRLSAAQMGRRHLLLGRQHNGTPVNLAVRGRTILIAGEPGTGKSWVAGLICEQLILQGYSLCVLDSEGDYRSLESLPGVIVMGGDDPPPQARELLRALRHPDVSIVIDLSKLAHERKVDYLHTVLPLLMTWRQRSGVPHKIVVDEAHHYLGAPGSEQLLDPELAGYVFVTYRVSGLAPRIRDAADAVVIVTRETDPREAAVLLGLCRPASESRLTAPVFSELSMKEAALLPGPEESLGHVRRFQLAPRLTTHVRHRAKYLDMPVLDAQAFVFTDGGHAGPRARTLKEFMGLLAALPAQQIAAHLQRNDFSRWLTDVFKDHPLGAFIKTIEERIGTEEPQAIAAAIAQAIRARYETAGGSTPTPLHKTHELALK